MATRWWAAIRDRPSLLVGGAAVLCSAPGLFNDFVYDDRPLIRDDPRVHDFHRLPEIFSSAYWPAPYVQQLYRPLSTILYQVEYHLGAGAPLVFRVLSMLLYVVVCLQLFRFVARFLPMPVAIAISMLFAVHPVHVEVLAQGVNQSELVVAILAFLMVGRFLDARSRGQLRAADCAVIGVAYLAACLTKESGFVLPLLLVAAEVLLVGRRAESRSSLLNAGFATLIAAAVAIGLREMAVGAPVMRHVAGPLQGLTLAERMHLMLQVIPQWVRLFLWPARLDVNYVPRWITYHPDFDATDLLAIGILVVAVVAIDRLWRRPLVAFGLLWTAITLLPVSNVLPTGLLLAERTLFLPSAGVLMTIGGVVAIVWEARPSALLREVLVTGSLALGLLGVIKSVNRLSLWNSAHFLFTPSATSGR